MKTVLPNDMISASLQKMEVQHAELLRHFCNQNIDLIDRSSTLTDEELQAKVDKVPVELGGVYVLLGIGDGRYLTMLAERLIPGCFLICYEQNVQWFQTLCIIKDLTTVWQNRFLKVVVGEPNAVQGHCEVALLKAIGPLMCIKSPDGFEYEQEAYGELMEGALAFIAVQQGVKFATLDQFGGAFMLNYLANLPVYANAPGGEALRGKGKGRTGVVVGSGPSLNKALIYWLTNHKDLILIAADSAVRAMVNMEIYPQIIVTVDPQPITATKLNGLTLPDKTILVCHPHGSPEIIKAWRGQFVLSKTQTPIDMYFGESWPDKETLEGLCHCQVHMGLNVAQRLEVDRIVLVGCDLCWTDEVMHATGASYLEDVKLAARSVDAMDVTNREGHPVTTSRLFQSYRQMWSLKAKDCTIPLSNASEGGLRIEHTRDITIKEARKEIPVSDREPWQLDLSKPEVHTDLLVSKLKALEGELRTTNALATRLSALCHALRFTRTPHLSARAERLSVRLQRFTRIIDYISVCSSRANRLLLSDKAFFADRNPKPLARLKQQRIKTLAFSQTMTKYTEKMIPLAVVAQARLTDPADPCYRNPAST